MSHKSKGAIPSGDCFDAFDENGKPCDASAGKLKALMKPSRTLSKVVADMSRREKLGLAKYGVTVDHSDLTQRAWLQHAYEEALDLCLYLRRALDES